MMGQPFQEPKRLDEEERKKKLDNRGGAAEWAKEILEL